MAENHKLTGDKGREPLVSAEKPGGTVRVQMATADAMRMYKTFLDEGILSKEEFEAINQLYSGTEYHL